MIHLAPRLRLSTDAVTEVFGILGARGSGKTTTASVFAEQLLAHQLPLVILDPTDAWWGLRSSKDGKADGYPITIIGGEHADAPLEETAGKVIADLVAEEAPPLVLSLRLLSGAAMRRFAADFFERLYEKNRNALHVFIDEADTFAPQRIMKGGERLFGAVDQLVRRGRSSGLGVTLISQRSAAISKDVLSQCSTLIAHRASHPRDVEPVLEWMRSHVSKEITDMVHASIAKLANGEAWLMSPEWLDVFGRFQMNDRTTFNSSATPKAGERRIVPKRLAPVDLAALQKRMAATIERAKADDPRELRKEIERLKQEARVLGRLAEHSTPKRVEVPALTKQQSALLDKLEGKVAALRGAARSLGDDIEKAVAGIRATVPTPTTPAPVFQKELRAAVRNSTDGLTDTQRRILTTLVMLKERGITRSRVATARWMGIHPNGGRYLQDIARLREQGFINPVGMEATASGAALADIYSTGEAAALATVDAADGPRGTMLKAIVAAKRPLSRQDLAALLQLHPNGGRFLQNLARLREMQLIPERGDIIATEATFR